LGGSNQWGVVESQSLQVNEQIAGADQNKKLMRDFYDSLEAHIESRHLGKIAGDIEKYIAVDY
jgi:hypothetical protein